MNKIHKGRIKKAHLGHLAKYRKLLKNRKNQEDREVVGAIVNSDPLNFANVQIQAGRATIPAKGG